jgi:hypothetical protein
MLRQGPRRTFSNRSHRKLTRLPAAAVNLRANPGRVLLWMMISLLHKVISFVVLIYFAFGPVYCHAKIRPAHNITFAADI